MWIFGAMRSFGGSGNTLTLFLLVGLLQPVAQNTAAEDEGDHGPANFLMSNNHLRYIKTSNVKRKRHHEATVPDYLLELRERHEKEWMSFGQADGGHGSNLGIITSIRHHPNVGSKQRNLRWQKQQYLNFRVAGFSTQEQLIAGSVRLPFRGHTNISIPVSVWVRGIDKTTNGDVYVESGRDPGAAWLNVPLPPALLHSLLRRKRLLRLQVILTDTTLIDPALTPHLLTFHRSQKQAKRLKRIRKSTIVQMHLKDNRGTNQIGEAKLMDMHIHADPQDNHISKNRKRRSPRYLLNQRYIASTCQRRDLKVNFNTVGWSHWVIAPTVYNAGYCYGYCPFPLSVHFNTTNHAIIMYLLYNLRLAPPQVTRPCCVPLTFSHQSILYFEGDEVVLQVYEDMIVKTCGCR